MPNGRNPSTECPLSHPDLNPLVSALQNAVLEPVAQCPDLRRLVFQGFPGQFSGFVQADDPRHVLRSGAPSVFLSAAEQQGLNAVRRLT